MIKRPKILKSGIKNKRGAILTNFIKSTFVFIMMLVTSSAMGTVNLRDYTLEKSKIALGAKLTTMYPRGLNNASKACVEMAYPRVKGPIVFYPRLEDVNKEASEFNPQDPAYRNLISFFKRSVFSIFDVLHLRLMLSQNFFSIDPKTLNEVELNKYAGQLLAILDSYEDILNLYSRAVTSELAEINKKLSYLTFSHVELSGNNKIEFDSIKKKQQVLNLESKTVESFLGEIRDLHIKSYTPQELYFMYREEVDMLPTSDPVKMAVSTEVPAQKSLKAIDQAQRFFKRYELKPMIVLERDYVSLKNSLKNDEEKPSSAKFLNIMPFVIYEVKDEVPVEVNTEIKKALFEDLMNLAAGQPASIYSIIGQDMFDEPDALKDQVENFCQILKR